MGRLGARLGHLRGGDYLRGAADAEPPGGGPPAVGRALILEPEAHAAARGNQHEVTATLYQDAVPVAGATIHFAITGANTAEGTDVTDVNGEATFSYTGENVGVDVITAKELEDYAYVTPDSWDVMQPVPYLAAGFRIMGADAAGGRIYALLFNGGTGVFRVVSWDPDDPAAWLDEGDAPGVHSVGSDGSGFRRSGDWLYHYDFARHIAFNWRTGAWVTNLTAPPVSERMTNVAAESLEPGVLLYFGGWTGAAARSQVMQYTRATDTWNVYLGDLPTGAMNHHHYVGRVGDVFYTRRGSSGVDGYPEQYSVELDPFASAAVLAMPGASDRFTGGCSDGTRMWAIGGHHWAASDAHDQVRYWTPGAGAWTLVSSHPHAQGTYGLFMLRLRGYLYTVGGSFDTNWEAESLCRYTPAVVFAPELDPDAVSDTATMTWGSVGLGTPGHIGATPVHVIVGPNGATDWPIVSGFSWTETALGGQEGCGGRIDADRWLQAQHIYRPGALWLVLAWETGEVLFIGTLDQPLSEGGTVELRASGGAKLFEEFAERLNYQNRRYADWSALGGDPHAWGSAKDSISVSLPGNLVKIAVPKGSDIKNGDSNGVGFFAPGHPSTRLAFDIEQNRVPVAGTKELRVITREWPSGAKTTRLAIDMNTRALSSSVDTDTAIVGGLRPGDDDVVAIEMVHTGVDTDPTTDRYTWKITNLRVQRIADDDEMTVSEMMADVAARMNVGDALIEPSNVNGLPLDIQGEDLHAVARHCALLSDRPYGVYPHGLELALRFMAWDDDVLTLIDPEMPKELDALDQYDRAQVAYRFAGGAATGIAEAEADPNPLRTGRTAPPIRVFDEDPTEEKAEDLAQLLADQLVRLQLTGTVTFTRALDSQGLMRPAKNVHAGMSLRHPEHGAVCRILSIEHDGVKATVTYVDGLAFIENLAALKNQQQALKGK